MIRNHFIVLYLFKSCHFIFFFPDSAYSTAASPICSSRTSSRTLMTPPTPSWPSSPAGESQSGVSCQLQWFQELTFLSIRVVKAGSELTWNYAANALNNLEDKQEVPCLCHSDGCQGWLHIEENFCDTLDLEVQ